MVFSPGGIDPADQSELAIKMVEGDVLDQNLMDELVEAVAATLAPASDLTTVAYYKWDVKKRAGEIAGSPAGRLRTSAILPFTFSPGRCPPVPVLAP